MSQPLIIPVTLSTQEIATISLCLHYMHQYMTPEHDHRAVFSALLKLEPVALKEQYTPFDTDFQFTEDELMDIVFALNLMLAEVPAACAVGGPADHTILDSIHISQLANHLPTIRNILRRLDTAHQLSEQQQQISTLQATATSPLPLTPAPIQRRQSTTTSPITVKQKPAQKEKSYGNALWAGLILAIITSVAYLINGGSFIEAVFGFAFSFLFFYLIGMLIVSVFG